MAPKKRKRNKTERSTDSIPGLLVAKDKAFTFAESSVITIEVGSDSARIRFTAHEGVICKRSEYFRRAMNGNWAESVDRLIKLRDIEPDDFEAYLNIVYWNQLAPTDYLRTGKFHCSQVYQHYNDLARLYVLAERLQDVSAKNTIVLGILSISKMEFGDDWYVPSGHAITTIYNGSVEGDKCRKLLVDLWTYFQGEVKKEKLESCPPEFVTDLLLMHVNGCKLGYALETNGSQYLVEIPTDGSGGNN